MFLRPQFSLVLVLATAASAAPVYNQLYGGPGPSSATDALFVAAGNTAYESFGFEVSFNSGQRGRINALTNVNNFTFSVASVNVPLWVPNRLYTFVESYSGDVTKQLNISITDTVLNTTYTIPQYNVTFGSVQNLIVRMVAPDPDTTGTPRPTSGSLAFANWRITGTGSDGSSLTNASFVNMPGPLTLATIDNPGVNDIRLINYFSLGGVNFTMPWTLNGSFTMNWAGSTSGFGNPTPGSNDLAFQIKAYQLNLTPTPEPSTYLLLGAGLVVMGIRLRSNRTKEHSH
jgi:hypothetical protein